MNEKRNESDNLLGKAMRRVIEESLEPVEERLGKRVDDVKTELKGDIAELKEGINRLETDMENGFNELRPLARPSAPRHVLS